jgi:hypothetical protein
MADSMDEEINTACEDDGVCNWEYNDRGGTLESENNMKWTIVRCSSNFDTAAIITRKEKNRSFS